MLDNSEKNIFIVRENSTGQHCLQALRLKSLSVYILVDMEHLFTGQCNAIF